MSDLLGRPPDPPADGPEIVDSPDPTHPLAWYAVWVLLWIAGATYVVALNRHWLPTDGNLGHLLLIIGAFIGFGVLGGLGAGLNAMWKPVERRTHHSLWIIVCPVLLVSLAYTLATRRWDGLPGAAIAGGAFLVSFAVAFALAFALFMDE